MAPDKVGCQYLLDVGISQFFGGFALEKNFVPHHEIGVVKVWEDNALVGDFIVLLPRKRNLGAAQFYDQGILVNNFIMALEGLGLFTRTRGQARSIRLLIPTELLPTLLK